jgi:hypothetical protein
MTLLCALLCHDLVFPQEHWTTSYIIASTIYEIFKGDGDAFVGN